VLKKKNAIPLFTFFRNFLKRADGNPNLVLAFVGSPELVTALAIAGDLGFNPLTDTFVNGARRQTRKRHQEMNYLRLVMEDPGFQAPAVDGSWYYRFSK
jgi:aconitate hydratase